MVRAAVWAMPVIAISVAAPQSVASTLGVTTITAVPSQPGVLTYVYFTLTPMPPELPAGLWWVYVTDVSEFWTVTSIVADGESQFRATINFYLGVPASATVHVAPPGYTPAAVPIG